MLYDKTNWVNIINKNNNNIIKMTHCTYNDFIKDRENKLKEIIGEHWYYDEGDCFIPI